MHTVMVVEDEQLIALDIARALRTLGYAVTGTAASARDCIAGVEKQRPDLVLMDIHLAAADDGSVADGIEAARTLRDRFDVPVVYLSAHVDEKTLTRAKQTAPLGYLVKPFRASELKSAVELGLYRHKLERQLRTREHWLSTTLRALGEAVIAVDPEGCISFMNAAAETLLSAPEHAVRGMPLASVVTLLDEKTREPLPEVCIAELEPGACVKRPACIARLAAGGDLPVQHSVAAIIDERGQRLGAVSVLEDLTEIRRSQQQMAMADRLASLGALAAGIAHEINNPLTYISGNIGFLAEELSRLAGLVARGPEASAQAEMQQSLAELTNLVREVEEGATRVGRIVADLGFFSKRDTGPQRGDVIAPLEWALRVSHSAIAPRAQIKRDFMPVPEVRADEGKLGQVFLNLLLNASYAMQGGDPRRNELSVTVELESSEEPAAKEWVRVTVRDTGTGMTPEVLARVFDPFFTTKPVGLGTGLGLSVCHGMLADMGGEISATSELGKGSAFVVRLPVANLEEASGSGAPRLQGARGRVLVVDDELRVLNVLGRMLRPAHDVVLAHGAQRALEQIRSGASFDVIVCDVLMPEINGIEFYQKLSALAPELGSRVIFLSGGVNTELAAEFFQTVPNMALQKPPSRLDLLAAVERQLLSERAQ